MWELDYEESWVLKNWCFWTVVLEKTLESPLDWKEIHSVHPKGNQSWIFIGRTDAEVEAHIHWVSDAIQPSHPHSLTAFSLSFPASGCFPVSQFFASGGQSIRVSASVSVLPVNIKDFPLGLTGLIFLQSKGLSRVFSNTTVQKHQFCTQLSLWSNSHIYT